MDEYSGNDIVKMPPLLVSENELSDDDDLVTTKRRKRYEVRRSGSEECLLGFNEESGEAEISSKMISNKLTAESTPEILELANHNAHIVGDDSIVNTVIKRSLVSPTQAQKPLSAQDDYYKKPFAFGWKRELVWRANLETSKDKADVYFISPTGKKLRTRSDIVPLLEGDLTIDHFCFMREPVGGSPNVEIVRSAKPSSRVSVAAATIAAAAPASSIGKRISKPKAPKGASPPPQGWTPTRALKVNNAALVSSAGGSRHISNPIITQSANKNSLKQKRHIANDIENDLKQINDSIRNDRKQSLDGSLHVHSSNVGVNSVLEYSNKAFASNFFSNVSFAYDALLYIFKYLKIHERGRTAAVCKLWHLASKDTSLWQNVRMKNSKVSNWAAFATALRRGETKHLDLRKMLLSSSRTDDMWREFMEHIGTVYTLEEIDLCRCTSTVVDSLFKSNKNLKILNAMAINDDQIDLQNVALLHMLEELRLRTCEPCVVINSLQPLAKLGHLKHLSLTAIKGLGTVQIDVLSELVTLISLELGECDDFDDTFAETVLPKLTQLQRLRLENGPDAGCCTLKILESVSLMANLFQLEIINFDIKPGFDVTLKQCGNIKKLLLIPTYISQSATTNHIVLNAVQEITDTLISFTWGVTVELLRVTALYVDQCEESAKKEKHHFDECIPVLKPVPGAPPADDDEEEENVLRQDVVASDVPQIEILPLDKVEIILATNLPNTKFSIVKIPYHATCKQQLVE